VHVLDSSLTDGMHRLLGALTEVGQLARGGVDVEFACGNSLLWVDALGSDASVRSVLMNTEDLLKTMARRPVPVVAKIKCDVLQAPTGGGRQDLASGLTTRTH
jgi:hypothetical protein